MLFRGEFHQRIAAGEVTLTFRAWKRARVRQGRRYRIPGAGTVEVLAVDEVPVRSITSAQARRSGFADVAGLLDALGQPGHDDRVFCVRFRLAGADDHPPPIPPRAFPEVAARLQAMDRRSARGPWTTEVLSLIAAHPAISSAILAERLGRARLAFKADVRKLKVIGLTESLDVGYRLTPLGRRVLDEHVRSHSRA